MAAAHADASYGRPAVECHACISITWEQGEHQIQKHKFDLDFGCGSGQGEALLTHSAGLFLTRQFLTAHFRANERPTWLTGASDAWDGEGDDGCRACGGTSNCHTDLRDSKCNHAMCEGGGASLLAASTAARHIAMHEMQPLRSLMTLNREVFLNVRRSAIQVRGCRGVLIAHFPISDAEVAQLIKLGEVERAVVRRSAEDNLQ